MTDYFALLGQPRRLLLDPDALQARFHRLARERHPDAQPAASSSAPFAELNDAYQCLLDPRRRLQHFLALAGHEPGRDSPAVPVALGDLFFAVAAAQEKLRAWSENNSAAGSSSIGRALAAHTAARLAPTLTALLTQVEAQSAAALREMPALESDLPALAALGQQLAYLERWRGKLREDLLRLEGVTA